jgi:hypothetical protein
MLQTVIDELVQRAKAERPAPLETFVLAALTKYAAGELDLASAARMAAMLQEDLRLPKLVRNAS